MTAEEIRNTSLNTEAEVRNYLGSKAVSFEFWMREIAAQLATLNINIRELIDATRPKASQ